MTHERWYRNPEEEYEIRLPRGWMVDPAAEEDGVEIHPPTGAGVLHLLAFSYTPIGPADPADELYGFLAEQGIELAEDEVEDLPLAAGAEMALCEYISEEADADDEMEDGGEESTFWLVGVATGPDRLLFASYSCPAGAETADLDGVREALASLRFTHPEQYP